MAHLDSQRFLLTEAQIRNLTVEKIPSIGPSGKTVFIPNPNPGWYRFRDATPGAPPGFGFYVGRRVIKFEISAHHAGRFRRITIGSTSLMTLTEAHDEARFQWRKLTEAGDHPTEIDRKRRAAAEAGLITVRQCMEEYIHHLKTGMKDGGRKAKPASWKSAENALARMERVEVRLKGDTVSLADKVVKQIDPKTLDEYWKRLRTTAMVLSNRLPPALRLALAEFVPWSTKNASRISNKAWWELDATELAAVVDAIPVKKGTPKIKLTARLIARVNAAGMATAEHTFSDASRAIRRAVNAENQAAQQEGRAPVLHWNPMEVLKDYFRGLVALRSHYRKAEVRNPLGTEDKTLPRVLKAIVARRTSQGGVNRQGADYLLLTLLWGSRRTEGARLRWYDRCTDIELKLNLVSWVWLANRETDVNPITGRRGSQVYFHDTKNGEERFLPIVYFAKRILLQRRAERNAREQVIPKEIAAARTELERIKSGRRQDHGERGKAELAVERAEARLANLAWIFPARSFKAKAGHYSDSKSIINGVRHDAGLFSKNVDIGLTNHDLRRTLGRYAEKLYAGGRLVSQILHHRMIGDQSPTTQFYNEQEWIELRDALAHIEETMISSSPRVWNILRGSDKIIMDEANDPPIHDLDLTAPAPTGDDSEE